MLNEETLATGRFLLEVIHRSLEGWVEIRRVSGFRVVRKWTIKGRSKTTGKVVTASEATVALTLEALVRML